MEDKEIIDKKEFKYKKILFILLTVVLLILLVVASISKEFQNDTFYTIKCGEYIWNNGITNLTQDPFSMHDLPYTFPHWLYDLGIYLIYSSTGFAGVYISTIAFSVILGLLVYINCESRSKNKPISLIITILVMYAMRPYLTARAQLLTFILFLWELYSIEKYLETTKKRYLVYLIIIPLLITQLHCAVFPVFFILVLPYIAEYLLMLISDLNIFDNTLKFIFNSLYKFEKDESRKEKYSEKIKKIERVIQKTKIEKEEKRKKPYKIIRHKNKAVVLLIIIICVAVLTGLLNPGGTGAYDYIVKIAKGNTMQSINEHLPLTLINNREFSVAIIAFVLILLFTDSKIRLSDFFMIAGLTYLSFKSARQISLFLIICSPILAKLVTDLIENFDKEISKKVYNFSTSVMGMIIIVLLMTIYAENEYKSIANQSFINETSYPVQASEWIKENLDLENLRLYNEYNYGSYLLFEGIPVFIDSRCDLYTPQFNENDDLDIFSDSLAVPDMNENYETIFNKYNINFAMLLANSKVCQLIDQDSNYSKVYIDDYFVIYQRLNTKADGEN